MTSSVVVSEFELCVIRDGKPLKTIPVSSDGSYSVGRSESCQISISDPGLSRVHLILTMQNGCLSVCDKSSFGSRINGTALEKNTEYAISENTHIDLAECSISLFINLDVSGTLSGKTQLAVESVLSTPMRSDSISRATTSPTQVQGLLDKLKTKGQLTLGRSESCDLIVPSLQVSRQHAILRMQGNDIVLEDLNTTNGTYLNGERIVGSVVIQTSDQITIGASVFILDDGGSVNIQYAIVADNIEKVYPKGFVGLNKMSIKIPSNEFVALMGPSGCGKSTLLKCLNGANPVSKGKITIQGLPLNNANFNTLKKHIGYVPQDDIVHSELTVEKTLYYAAKLRMANDVSNAEISEKIDQVLQSLNLDAGSIRHNRIRELSGGQRKRISIAVELLNDPTILFLDEPTSPLDPETIEDFLSCIKGLVSKGQTVIMVTHKPSDLSYVDKVIFLSKGGYQAYYGDKSEVLDYFDKKSIIEVYSLMKTPEVGKKWNSRWLEKHPITALDDQTESLRPKPATSLVRQYFWLSARYLNIKWNDSWNLLLLFAQPFIIAFLLIFIFWNLQLSVLFMMAISAVWFGVSNASKEIVSELAIYQRERMFNLNIGNYILSKISVLAIIAFFQVLIFVSIIYFTYGLREGDVQLWSFAPNVAFMFFLSVSATIFGLFLSSVFNNTEKVMTFVPIALMPQIMLAGIIAKMDNDLKILLSYFTLGRWGTEGFAHIQDKTALSSDHLAAGTEDIPASVMQYLPQPLAVKPGEPGPAFEMTLQAQGAIDQLNFYDKTQDYISLFPESLSGVVIAVMGLNCMFLFGIYWALKRKDSRFL